MFQKPFRDLNYSDIEKLKSDKICESPVLDYKRELLEDNNLLKHVIAFANTQGGILIFGIEETGKGGYPKEIVGIDKNLISKEKIEQVILSNTQPKLNIEIVQFDHVDPTKSIIAIQIPNNHLKPYMHGHYNKYYRRYNFEAQPMNEIEVSDAYGRRFAGYQEMENYISKTLSRLNIDEGKPYQHPQIIGKIIVIPTILSRMIETFDAKEFEWITALNFKPKFYGTSIISSNPTPSANGIKCQQMTQSGICEDKLEIHRNGCIEYASYFGEAVEGKMLFLHHIFCIKLLYVLQLASILYQKKDYFGDVKVICRLDLTHNSLLLDLKRNRGLDDYACEKNDIQTSREFSSNSLTSKYEYVASGIMNDIFNSYGLWKCPLFDDEGNFKETELK